MIFRTFSALVKLITVTRGDALRACPLAFILRAFGAAPLKNHDLAWIGSVPPAVATVLEVKQKLSAAEISNRCCHEP